ncbi:hypothetical protein [Pseudomonas orientalis]|uniref:Uncharacterized protein n=1 Tax=Pseudomonas orientalis TaxID=76758 RepID=A0A2L0RTK3_9PSED|nr:hypothetical protein [Pseudomonas orientalis]AUZ45369.1 hypothetical protein BOP93_07080 [Pseudomonas orientalis]
MINLKKTSTEKISKLTKILSFVKKIPKSAWVAAFIALIFFTRTNFEPYDFITMGNVCTFTQLVPEACANFKAMQTFNWFLFGLNGLSILIALIAFVVFAYKIMKCLITKKDVNIKSVFVTFAVATILQVVSVSIFTHTANYKAELSIVKEQLKPHFDKTSKVAK